MELVIPATESLASALMIVQCHIGRCKIVWPRSTEVRCCINGACFGPPASHIAHFLNTIDGSLRVVLKPCLVDERFLEPLSIFLNLIHLNFNLGVAAVVALLVVLRHIHILLVFLILLLQLPVSVV